MFEKLKNPKVWAPLVGSGALIWAWATGVQVSPEEEGQVVDQVVGLVTNLEAVYLAGAALLAGLAAKYAKS